MADDSVIIEHADGRRYSVPREAAGRLYPDFAIVGEESAEAFELVGVPTPRPPRRKPRTKAAKAKAAAPLASAPSDVEGAPV